MFVVEFCFLNKESLSRKLDIDFSNYGFYVFTIGRGERQNFVIIEIAFRFAKINAGDIIDVDDVAFVDS